MLARMKLSMELESSCAYDASHDEYHVKPFLGILIMDHETTVTTTQNFVLLGCHSEQYSINLSENLLSPNNTYTVHYTYPDNSAEGVVAEFVRDNQLLVKNPPEFEHPCTVHAEVRTNGSEQCLTKFSLDLVSPAEYLFRKYSLDNNEMSSSDKMTSALLAMSLSYYYVMEEQMKMEKKADKMLSTLLTCHGNNVPPKHITSMQSATCNGSIREFARHHHLHHTLRCLPPDALSTEDSPPKQPKLNGELKTITASPVTNIPEEEHYVPLIKVRHASQSKYTSTTTATNCSLPNDDGDGQTTENDGGAYEVPTNHDLNNSEYSTPARQPTLVQPYAVKKLEPSVSLGSILDEKHEYTYIEEPATMAPRRPRPPRPPPPKRKSTQRTLASGVATRRPPLDRRKSAPAAPTPKQSSSNRWYKTKH